MGHFGLGLTLGAVRRTDMAQTVPLPRLASMPTVTGTGAEATDLVSDESDTWAQDGNLGTVTAREYRLLIGGAPAAGPQTSPAITLPQGSAGQVYSHEIRVTVTEGGGAQSA